MINNNQNGITSDKNSENRNSKVETEHSNHAEPVNENIGTGFEEILKRPVLTAEDLLNMNITSFPFLLEGVFQKYGLAAISGPSDCGKSTLLRQFGISIVRGDEHFLGFKINANHRSVIYVSTEDDAISMAYLLKKQIPDAEENPKLKSLRYVFDSENLLRQLDEELTREPADCVIIDAFSDIYGDEMNASNKVRNFLQKFDNLAKKHRCLFLFLHHNGKRTEHLAPSKNNLLGSQGFEGKMRIVVEVRQDPKDTSLRHFSIVKGNYIPAEEKQSSFVLKMDKNMIFTNTGNRVNLDDLKQDDPRSAAKEAAWGLFQQGHSRRKVAEIMKNQGSKYGRTAINQMINEYAATIEPDPEDDDFSLPEHDEEESKE